LVFGVLALCFTTVQTINGINHENQIKQQIASQKQLDQSVRKLQDSIGKQIDDNGSSFPDPKQLNNIQGQLERSVQNFTGDKRKYTEVLVAFNHEIIDLSNQYQQAVNTYELAGGSDTEGITEPTQIDERIKLIDHVCEISGALIKLTKNAPGTLHKRMDENGVSIEYADRLLALSLPSFHINLILEIRSVSDNLFQHQKEIFTILRNDWGNWHYNTDSGTIAFENNQTMTKYNKLASEMEQLNNQLRDALHALLEAQRGEGG